MPLWEIYQRAVIALRDRMVRGEKIAWEPSRGEGGTPYNVRLPASTVATLRDIAKAQALKKTTVFLTALAYYLGDS